MVDFRRNLIRPIRPSSVDWSKHYPKIFGKEITEDLYINSKIIS
jgi:hypothetical protein